MNKVIKLFEKCALKRQCSIMMYYLFGYKKFWIADDLDCLIKIMLESYQLQSCLFYISSCFCFNPSCENLILKLFFSQLNFQENKHSLRE